MADHAAVPPPRIGQPSHPPRIGRYRILRVVGRGAMGVVYAAEDEVIGRVVGLKVLQADLEGDPATRARFQREAQAAAQLVHPNIITIYDAGQDQGRSFIAMQLLDGVPLAEYMKRPEASPLERKLDLMIQICEGLAAAHEQGIVHRDLKPNNLFVQTDGLLKIYDFGVARIAESNMTRAGEMIGTPDYMSPEQARGAPVDARSDIFSAGAVFYFMLAGRKPFQGSDLPTVMRQLQSEEPSPIGPASAPPELVTIVARAMSKHPDDRSARIQDVLTGLVRFRRQYQAETRRLVTTARTRFEALEKAGESLVDAATALGMPAAPVTSSLADRFPILAGGPVESAPVDRGHVTALLHELEAERHRLTSELELRRSHAAQIESARQILAAGDARGALQLFEAALAAYPDSRRARELADSCRAQAREQEAREQQVNALITAARRALDARDWTTGVERCDEALAILPRHEVATAVKAEIAQSIARERRRLDLQLQHVLGQAERAIDQQDFVAADGALTEAEGLQPEAPRIGELRRRLTEAEAAAEAARLLREMSAEEIRHARSLFRRGHADEAVEELRAFLDAEPGAVDAEAEFQRLVALREQMADSASERRDRIAGLLDGAHQAAEQRKVPEALGLLREALSIDPTRQDVAARYDELSDRDLRQRLAAVRARVLEQRSVDATGLLTAARDARARGYLATALDAALVACRVAPERAEAVTLVDELRREIEAEDIDLVDLRDAPVFGPTPRPVAEPPRTPTPGVGGVRHQVNQWADWLRRKPKS